MDDVGIQGLSLLLEDNNETIVCEGRDFFLVFDTYPKDFVKREFSQLRSHGCLCQLSNSIFGVFYTIAGL